jgi:RNA polymerase sigma factor (sigma-70 family)
MSRGEVTYCCCRDGQGEARPRTSQLRGCHASALKKKAFTDSSFELDSIQRAKTAAKGSSVGIGTQVSGEPGGKLMSTTVGPRGGDDPAPEWATKTQWGLIVAAGRSGSTQGQTALEELCRIYYAPVYAYILRHGYQTEDAQDLTQDFFARLVRHNWLSRADPGKGKFRSFLLTAVNHFLANEWRKGQAVRRGSGQVPISLDDTQNDKGPSPKPVCPTTPETVYEKEWAMALLRRALERLRQEQTTTNKVAQFDQLKDFLTGELEPGRYADAAARMNMTQGAVGVAIHRLRQRFREVLREEIAQLVATPTEIDEELHWLFSVLARG